MSSIPSPSAAFERADGPPAPWRRHLLRGLAALLVAALFVYGLMAIDAGISNYTSAGDPSVAAAREAAKAAADRGERIDSHGLGDAVRYQTLTLVAWLNSERYAYGENGLIETLVHYATMPTLNARILALHNVLGGFCMLFGAIQFWPAMRRSYPRWHRAFGMSYVIGAQVAMVAAASYLLLTPVDKIYDQMTFWVLLWAMALGVTVTLWLAMYHLWRGEIAQHQGYMCLNYGLLLTAPVLRLAWVGMGWIDPAARQIEGAFAAHAILVPLSLLCGYALFVVNRWSQRDRLVPATVRAEPQSLWSQGLTVGAVMALIVSALLLVQHLLLTPGLSTLDQAQVWMPAGLLALDQRALVGQPMLRLVFTAASVLGLLIGAWRLWGVRLRSRQRPIFDKRSSWMLAAAAAVGAVVQLSWGVAMGLPSFGTLTGGTLLVFGGLVTLCFAALLAWAAARGLDSWADEWAVFVLTCQVATPSFYVLLPLVAAFEPAQMFVAAGHVYRTAGVLQWSLLAVPFVCAMHNRVTRGKFAR